MKVKIRLKEIETKQAREKEKNLGPFNKVRDSQFHPTGHFEAIGEPRSPAKLGPLENPFKDNIRDNVGAGAKAGYGFDEKNDDEEDDRKR